MQTGRTVHLIRTETGERVGPFAVDGPGWQEVQPVVAGARQYLGLEVVVLRLLEVDEDRAGGHVTYLVENRWTDEFTKVDDNQRPGRNEVLPSAHPLRATWARPGGPKADVEWALSHLGLAAGTSQIRTWNLSSIWRLDALEHFGGSEHPSVSVRAWLKVVPPFFAHEGALIELLTTRGHPVPSLVAHAGNRLLMANVPGDDGYEATNSQRVEMMRTLVRIQLDAAGFIPALLRAGVPDWRAQHLHSMAESVASTRRHELTRDDAGDLDGLVRSIPSRIARVHECGIPDSVREAVAMANAERL